MFYKPTNEILIFSTKPGKSNLYGENYELLKKEIGFKPKFSQN